MKIRFISYVVILILGVCFSAQSQDDRKTYLGVKGGYNLSQVNEYHAFYGYNMDQGVQTGYQAGIVVMNFLRNHVGIQAELNYTQKGYIQKFDPGQPDYSAQFNYLELPFLVNVYTGKNRFHMFANAGCFFEYLVNVEQSAAPQDTGDWSFDPYVESRDPKFGYGFRGGVGSFYDFNFGTFMVSADFSYSLSNFIDPKTFDSGLPTLSNHYVLSITVGYLISFGEL
ncbi:hypothetical protein BFP72_03785 [Reichenbachiella sp. 5M10]|uniref:porin family protein n=1 Tax=Reichenbachiella sp. 5M10 TaxID=1889772 RepID=UPI000C1626B0|nr:porin family protein [Reichenbachiella sp. 5M10]PIB34592.1 hypothetical protein BFP72_03785 [Reichenbachiella sp. 5M10]